MKDKYEEILDGERDREKWFNVGAKRGCWWARESRAMYCVQGVAGHLRYYRDNF